MARTLVFVVAIGSTLAIVSTAARAEGAADRNLVPLLSDAFRRSQDTFRPTWVVEGSVMGLAVNTMSPQVRDQLVPILIEAHARHAFGYDRLRDLICTRSETMSVDRARACSTLPAWLEDGWQRRDRTEQWVVRGFASAVYLGAITGAAVERHQDAGREIATLAGAPVGALCGVTALLLFASGAASEDARKGSPSTADEVLVVSVVVVGSIAGGVVGAREARSLATSPGARAPVTAVALAPIYFTTLVMTF